MKRTSTISRLVEFGLRLIGMWPDSAYPNLYWSMTFYNIVAAVKRDWNDRVVSNSYSTMMAIANQSSRYSVVLIGLHFLTGFSLSIGAYMFRTINTDSEASTREFPVKMQFSFVVSESPVFECILFGQIFFLMLIAPVVGMINALLATLILHVGGQVDIMRQAIMDVHSNDKLDTSLTVLRDLIHRHRKIITLSNDIETLFSFIALLQLLWNTLIICFCGFMIILTLSSNKGIMVLIKSMFLYTVKTLEVFVFCYAGEFLSSKSKSISDAIYESLWYNMIPSDSRILLLIMVRSQKRLTITAGKIFDLTLEGFMSVMKASASYMSVLHAMY
ncbi:PREDICTED: odorant receptor 82a-like [Acromyrmex echinatior]|uniref:odorant receptor 82a-like n=1 Tax=Acromyrmex echinatior TaxID=103372 RepID=UPI000580C010|nr:PREDICTED: odorant receptor 82a-like [Acromyrmex echinatior]